MGDILVVEDEAFIAIDIEDAITDAGHGPVVVCATRAAAVAYVATARPAAAFLDINLGRGETSEDVANALIAKGSPVTFLSGYTAAVQDPSDPLSDVPRLVKPFASHELIAALERMLGTGPGR